MSVVRNDNKPLGIYIHIPFCKSKCKYCSFVSTPDFSLQREYVRTLVSEIENSDMCDAKADTVYIGGGTPSCLFSGGLELIIRSVRKTFDVDVNAEFTVECNPESVTDNFVRECKYSGVNRISIGLQSACDSVLKNIGRVHDLSGFISAVELLSSEFDNISSDMILGLPGQTASDIDDCIKIFDRYCSHVSVYALTVDEDTPLFKEGYRADDDFIAVLYDRAMSMLAKRGFIRYEVSNFARNGKFGRHNRKYWHCDPYLGFGAAAHGYDGDRVRKANPDSINDYIAGGTATYTSLTDKDMYNEYVMLALRTEDGIYLDDFRNRFGRSLETFCAENLRGLLRDGYLSKSDDRVRIPSRYMFVMNGIIEELMLD